MFALRPLCLAFRVASPSLLRVAPTMAQKRQFNDGKRAFKKNKKLKTETLPSQFEGTHEEVLVVDVRNLLNELKVSKPEEEEDEATSSLPNLLEEIDLRIVSLSSTGDGLAEKDGRIYVVPYSVPGDTVTARVFRHVREAPYSLTDFVKVVEGSEHRSEQPPCPYFTQCSGCQFQQLPYAYQLNHKQSIVEKAYQNFSQLPASAIPAVGATVASPLQYGYRTKLTPHFDGPPGGRRDKRNGRKVHWPEVPPIGFMKKNTRKTLDIEDCPIGTQAVRMGMKRERQRVSENIQQYQKGATLLLRENTERLQKVGGMVEEAGDDAVDTDKNKPVDEVIEDGGPEYTYRKTCITDPKAVSTEYIDGYRFDNPAGAFFQNNNSILPVVTQYIREHILGTPAAASSPAANIKDTSAPTNTTPLSDQPPPITNLIDAYCGSGFFTVALSTMFQRSIGIDISDQSITFARRNAAAAATQNSSLSTSSSTLSSSPPTPVSTAEFVAADANALFAAVACGEQRFLADETVVIIDPPRKGCDRGFVRQLVAFAPARICYVSCNVHTQARDVGWLVGGLDGKNHDGGEGSNSGERELRGLYEIESIRGFDFFPQTSHVEGVTFLRKKRGVKVQ